VVTSPSNTTAGPNFDVSGGAAGVDSAAAPISASYLGGWGGSWAGSGGNPNAGVHPNIAAPGAAGQVLINAYL
jgi:hypothetical protein